MHISLGRIFPVVLVLPVFFFVISHVAPVHAQQKAFKIVQGQDAPVCRAYLSALEQFTGRNAPVKEPPWCADDLNPSVKGFPTLERVYVTDVDEAFTLDSRIRSFLNSKNQYRRENRFTIKDKEENRRAIEESLKSKELVMWRYSTAIDIDNDGTPDDVLWYRYGRCNSSRPSRSVLMIVSPNSLQIDEDKTARYFAETRPYPVRTESFIQLRSGTLGLFRFAGRDYVYAWGNDVAWRKDRKPQTTSVVYYRVGEQVSVVCEIRWNE